ncbi:MAG: DUF1491 family protein [Kordiimonadaceae bacterium]|nr:DUF1491 family protein [Kordiimonadaceae bacterium]
MNDRLHTSFWVEAHVRTCFGADMPTFVVAKGDAERGGILLKVNCFQQGINLYEQAMDFDGNKMWRHLGAFEASAERDADMLLQKKRQFDADMWLLEIEDQKGIYTLDAPLSAF